MKFIRQFFAEILVGVLVIMVTTGIGMSLLTWSDVRTIQSQMIDVRNDIKDMKKDIMHRFLSFIPYPENKQTKGN